jgi:hypothetical protein
MREKEFSLTNEELRRKIVELGIAVKADRFVWSTNVDLTP